MLDVLDAQAAPPAQRTEALARLEKCARQRSVPVQDFVGSLYWVGHSLPGALVQTDLAKARLYLSNAAAHGGILDMAKLAEIELSQGNPDAAMVWAQLFNHYQSLGNSGNAASRSFQAELLKRIYQHFDAKHLDQVTQDANAFASQYDATIRAYATQQREKRAALDKALRQQSSGGFMPPTSPVDPFALPESCLAEYLIAYNNDGTVYGTWMLDALPDARCGKSLQSVAMHSRAAPATDRAPGIRLVLQQILWGDNRYSVGASTTMH